MRGGLRHRLPEVPGEAPTGRHGGKEMKVVTGQQQTPRKGEEWACHRHLGAQSPGGRVKIVSKAPKWGRVSVRRWITSRGVWSKKTWSVDLITLTRWVED